MRTPLTRALSSCLWAIQALRPVGPSSDQIFLHSASAGVPQCFGIWTVKAANPEFACRSCINDMQLVPVMVFVAMTAVVPS